MPTTAAGLAANIERSLDEYFRASLATTEGLAVHYNHDPVFNAAGPPIINRWVGLGYELVEAARDYDGSLNSTHKVSRVRGELNFLIAVRIPTVRNDLYAPAKVRDKVRKYVMPGTAIPIKDYDTGGAPTVGYLHCGASRGRLDDTGDESGVNVYSLSVESEYLELRT